MKKGVYKHVCFGGNCASLQFSITTALGAQFLSPVSLLRQLKKYIKKSNLQNLRNQLARSATMIMYSALGDAYFYASRCGTGKQYAG